MRARVLKILLAAAVGIVVFVVMLGALERHMIFHPSRNLLATGDALGRAWEDVWLTTSDGVRINGWFVPAAAGDQRELVLLLLHGNAGNITHRLDYFRAWLELGLNVFALDYRGYGVSEGEPDEGGLYLDAQAAYGWLRERGFPAGKIVVLGESLGGGVASELALRERVGGLVLQSSFTSIPDVAAELYPWLPVRWLMRTRFDTEGRLPRIRCPVLIVHSPADQLIGFHHAGRNFAAANEPRMLWKVRGDHNTLLAAGREVYQEGLEKFLATYFPSSDAP